jgi:acyl-coenzyme A synthetase/AMP-(fatty) acid ligase
LYGSLKAVLTPHIIASTAGLSNIQTRLLAFFYHSRFWTDSLQIAIIYEADEPKSGSEISYAQLLREVCSVANVLKSFGVKKGDTVSVYLPMTWHAVATFMACARIGAVHSVVFAGFSAESLRDRVNDCKSRVVITSDEGRRGGKTIATKRIVDAALKECPLVEHVLVLKRTGESIPWTQGRDKWWHDEITRVPNYCPPEIMASEDPLFILYVREPIFCGYVVRALIVCYRHLGLLESPKVLCTPPGVISYVLP